MVVASRCFAFRALITQARIWKCFQVQNSTSLFYLPNPSSAENRYKESVFRNMLCQFLFAGADILGEKSPYFGKHLLAKQELITRHFVDKTLQLVRISLLISAIQRVLRFFLGNLFYKSTRKLFSCVCIAWYKHEKGWERQLCKPETKSRVCITVENSPNASCVYSRLCKHRKKVFYCFYK